MHHSFIMNCDMQQVASPVMTRFEYWLCLQQQVKIAMTFHGCGHDEVRSKSM